MGRVGREMEEDLSAATARGWLRAELSVAEMRARVGPDYAEVVGRPLHGRFTPLPESIRGHIRRLQGAEARLDAEIRRLEREARRRGPRRGVRIQQALGPLRAQRSSCQAEIRQFRRLVAGPGSRAHVLQARLERLARRGGVTGEPAALLKRLRGELGPGPRGRRKAANGSPSRRQGRRGPRR